ncbi:hypothetical protein ACFQ51_51810 [Streptomyces kaempferi]
MGREEFPAWPGLQQQRREAERKEREAAELAATRFGPALARAVKAAEEIMADPGSATFRALERRRQAVCVAMERQASRAAAARLESCGAREYSDAGDELNRLLQLTQELFRALRAAEELLPPAEAIKAATSRYAARIDQVATERYSSLPANGDGAYEERRAMDTARRRVHRS